MNVRHQWTPVGPVRAATLALMAIGGLAGPAAAQGFAGMGTDAEGYALPQPGVAFSFPADHGPHPAFRIEWWYITANLEGPEGRAYGVQWTLFRNALAPGGTDAPGWAATQGWMGHAALTTPERHFVTERIARGGIGQAGVESDPFEAWIDDWGLSGPSLSDVRMTATGPDFAYDLALATDRPFVPQGDNGYSVKSEAGQASYYYSQPFYQVEGTLTLPDGKVQVTGDAWLDREWSSQPLGDDQTGWDWFSLHLDGGEKLMGYRLRDASGDDFFVSTWIAADGTPTPYEDGHLRGTPLERTEVAGREIPTHWSLALPERDLDIEVRAINSAAWMDTSVAYWEGPVTVTGSHDGIGYLEMTGYE
ncbi:Predicted secreted hydrolase [Tranquillimonas rosea]|uniref:Predicted secreted hydrolase n=1 Tax=Tranquillimonas rosea TaxID=641238 RepID=A0A1H9Q7Y8_9RHOB|nr:Predicted secreted hydrolase [Tranquillimonas rosea]